MWDLLGKVRRARCWPRLSLSSQQTADQGEEQSDNRQVQYQGDQENGGGIHSFILQSFRSFLYKTLSSI